MLFTSNPSEYQTGAFMVAKRYVEQFERVKRLLGRFEALGQGIAHTQHSANYDDDVHSFFQNCYHLKDWIKNDPCCATWPCVEAYINTNQDLQLCADICNAQKHLKLTNHRSGQNPRFGGTHTKLIIAEGGADATVQIANSYSVETQNAGTVDALTLGLRCVSAWEAFIIANDP